MQKATRCNTTHTTIFTPSPHPTPHPHRYITEGFVRLGHTETPAEHLHSTSPTTPPVSTLAQQTYKSAWTPGLPFHTFEQAAWRPLQPNTPRAVSVVLLPTAYTLKEGHVLRLALGGHDEVHFDTPGIGTRVMQWWCGDGVSRVELPTMLELN